MNIQVKRSRRKTICLQILDGDTLLLKAPYQASDADIQAFLNSHQRWISTHLQKRREEDAKASITPRLTKSDIQRLAEQALQYIPERVRYYAPKIGVTYGSITIRNQTSRWGSCSSKGNLNFNCLLMLTPKEVIDSVIVHELCHRKEMNHSPRFYAEIYKVFPDYDRWDQWLKENGKEIIRSMTG